MQQIEGYVSGIFPVKKSKNDNGKKYFYIIFQRENSQVRVVCFSPEERLRLKKRKSESASCVISNVLKENNGFKLTNSMTVKSETLAFGKNKNCK